MRGCRRLAAFLVLALAPSARGEDVFYLVNLSDLKGTEAVVPEAPKDATGLSLGVGSTRDLRLPNVVIEGPGEAYLAEGPGETPMVAFRLPERREVAGRVFRRDNRGPGMRSLAFKGPMPEDDPAARTQFFQIRSRHYERLFVLNLPGSAWFLHQARESLVPLGPGGNERALANLRAARPQGMVDTFDFFSGNRAIDENLQLDRPLNVRDPKDAGAPRASVAIDTIPGIKVAAIDFAARLQGRTPPLDALARQIPSDQPAVFFPDLAAANGLLALSEREGAALAAPFRIHADDRQVRVRYELQLALTLDELARFPGLASVRSIALTGSDPSLLQGTDLALLFETDDPDALWNFLRGKLDDRRRAEPDVADVGGESKGIPYAGARSPDRSTCSYAARMGRTVVLTNSLAQLARLTSTHLGRTPNLAAEADYRFFRDRYPIGPGAESAFLILTDATIRRIGGPRWRIGESRRVRALAGLAELQAANAPLIVARTDQGARLVPPPGSVDLGPLRLVGSGVVSPSYGSLAFQTPVIERPIEAVDPEEASAYKNWSDNYQTNWRGLFDPIALRLLLKPGRFEADLSVMPLIANSDYRAVIDLIGQSRLAPQSGDPHPGTLAHGSMAIDSKFSPMQSLAHTIAPTLKVPRDDLFGWLGRSGSFYLDADPFWAELLQAKDPYQFTEANYQRIPVGLHFDVIDVEKLNRAGLGLRHFLEENGYATYEAREHRGVRYWRLVMPETVPPSRPARASGFVYGSPRSLTLSLSEPLIHRAIDRDQARARGEAPPSLPPAWVGEGLALRAEPGGLALLFGSSRDDRVARERDRAWGNLPILNEWRRLFPDRDPVEVHRAIWGITLIDPAGGRYAWNERWSTMESTTFGHPGEPKPGPPEDRLPPLVRSAAFGLSFESGGLRARTVVEIP